MDVALIWAQLAATAAVIFAAAHFLAKAAGDISVRTGLGRSFVGVVLLATATSLPELGTGVSSVALVGQPDLAAGDAFGSNLFNLIIIGLMELVWRRGPLLNAVDTTSVVVGAVSVGVIGLATVAVVVHGATDALAGWLVSPLSVALLLVFALGMYPIYVHEKSQENAENPDQDDGRTHVATLRRAISVYGLASVVVVGASVALSLTGESLADLMGWEASFVGTQFLALSTSLPELATSFAAIRLRLPEMAIGNLLGSNIFNMGIVLFLDDLAFTDGVLWRAVSPVHAISGVAALLMTGIVILAILRRGRSRPFRLWTWEAAALTAVYVASSALVFRLG